jgi:hypothetical protein
MKSSIPSADFGGAIHPLAGKHFLQQNGFRAAKNTACCQPEQRTVPCCQICPFGQTVKPTAVKRARRQTFTRRIVHGAKVRVQLVGCQQVIMPLAATLTPQAAIAPNTHINHRIFEFLCGGIAVDGRF